MANIKSLQTENAIIKNNLNTSVIKATSYENLPIASSTTSGIVKIDNVTIKVNPFGQLYTVVSSSGGDTPQEVINHINNSTIHLNQEQITSLASLKNHLINNEVHLSFTEKKDVSNLSVHYSNSSIHLIGDTLTKFNESYNHSIDNSAHISAIERETLNTVTEHFNNTEIHLSSDDRDKVNNTVNHINNTDIHMSENDRALLDSAINSIAGFSAHTLDDTIHFTGTEKVDVIAKANMAEEAKSTADIALNLVQNIAVNKLDSTNHTSNKLLITDSSGAVVYHQTISADKVASKDDIISSSHVGDSTHITSAERTAWNNKSNLSLGVTSSTAYRGDYGNAAYTHSQSSHAPSNAQANVQADWNASSGDSYIRNKPSIPSSLPANGGNSDTVNGVKITSSKTAPSSPKVGDIWITW